MAWGALIIAGFTEVIAVWSMRKTVDKVWYAYVLMVLSFGASFALLSYAMQSISMGTAYAVWTGIGTIGATVMGMLLFNEPREWQRFFFIAIIVGSAVGLKLIA